MIWEDSFKKLEHISYRVQTLIGRYEGYKEEQKQCLLSRKKCQKRIEDNVFVKEILSSIQNKEHQRALGSYEKLLSAFLTDVLPGKREVVLDLHVERNVPAMEVFLRKGDNLPLEDALKATGGSVTNLLSIGLRSIALLKSGQKKFLVLDEADCWIKPDLIPAYASVVKQISEELGIQILIISHHNESLFDKHIHHRLNLTKLESGMIMSNWSPSSNIPFWDEKEDGIRSITLKNFQSHQHTCISLSPTITLLQGDNDIGKSSIVNALHAVFNGLSNESFIKHFEAQAEVVVDFGHSLLTWNRFKKGKVKVSYELMDTETHKILHSENGTKVPDWIQEEIKIGKVDGLSIQLGQQQEPIFLLNQSPSIRAKALAVGSESWYIDNMMEINKKEVQHANFLLKENDKKIEWFRRKIDILESFINKEKKNIDILLDKIPLIKEQRTSLNRVNELYNQWFLINKKYHAIYKIENKNFNNIRLPEYKSVKFDHIYNNWRVFHRKIISLNKLHQEESRLYSLNFKHNNEINSLLLIIKKWDIYNKKISILSSVGCLSDLPIHTIKDIMINQNLGVNVYNKWLKNYDNFHLLKKTMENSTQEIKQLQKTINNQFPVCPTCQRPWDKH